MMLLMQDVHNGSMMMVLDDGGNDDHGDAEHGNEVEDEDSDEGGDRERCVGDDGWPSSL